MLLNTVDMVFVPHSSCVLEEPFGSVGERSLYRTESTVGRCRILRYSRWFITLGAEQLQIVIVVAVWGYDF